MGPDSITGVLIRRGEFRPRHMQGECDVKTEAETGVVYCLEARDGQGWLVTLRGWKRQGRSLQSSERAWPCGHLDFRLAASRIAIITSFKPFSLWYFITAAAL